MRWEAVVLWLHLLAAVGWVGGMIFVAAVLAPVARELPPAARTALFGAIGRRFRTLGWVSIGLLLVTGIGNTLYRVPNLDYLLASRAGPILALKLVSVLAMIALAIVHDFWLGPRQVRLHAALAARGWASSPDRSGVGRAGPGRGAVGATSPVAGGAAGAWATPGEPAQGRHDLPVGRPAAARAAGPAWRAIDGVEPAGSGRSAAATGAAADGPSIDDSESLAAADAASAPAAGVAAQRAVGNGLGAASSAGAGVAPAGGVSGRRAAGAGPVALDGSRAGRGAATSAGGSGGAVPTVATGSGRSCGVATDPDGSGDLPTDAGGWGDAPAAGGEDAAAELAAEVARLRRWVRLLAQINLALGLGVLGLAVALRWAW